MKYTVTFVQYHTYEVEAKNESDAEVKAHKKFYSDMCRPIVNTYYDEVEIECEEGDEDE